MRANEPQLTDIDERHLVAEAKDGNKRALERLLTHTYPKMYRVALKYARDPDNALDAVQDACVQIVRNLSSFREEAKFSSWAVRIVINSCHLQHRKAARSTALTRRLISCQKAADNSLESQAQSRQSIGLVESFLRQRGQRDYKIFLDRYVAGQSIQKISEQTGLSQSAIKTRVHRARHHLRAHMEQLESVVEVHQPRTVHFSRAHTG